VQGVGFRAHAQTVARRLELVGFVRNRRDGAVEGEAQGTEAALAEFVSWLQTGPSWSQVDEVWTEDLPVVGDETTFEVRR